MKKTFLRDASNALEGKTVAPICSNGSLGLVKTVESIKTAAPKAKVNQGLSITGSGGKTLSKDLASWLKKTGLAK